jgi:hypothetical protein
MSVCPAGSFQHLYKLKDSNSGMAVIADGNGIYGLSHMLGYPHGYVGNCCCAEQLNSCSRHLCECSQAVYESCEKGSQHVRFSDCCCRCCCVAAAMCQV